jgi:transposase
VKHSKPSKLSRLREAGLLHAHPDRVRDRLFLEQSDFFDSHDAVQVRYELLRAHLVEGDKIAGVCRRFGVSRQTFYKFLARFLEQGSGGLLPGRPGPKGPSKLSVEVMKFAEEQLSVDKEISGAALASRIDSEFSVSLHKRTVEKLLTALRTKKNG